MAIGGQQHLNQSRTTFGQHVALMSNPHKGRGTFLEDCDSDTSGLNLGEQGTGRLRATHKHFLSGLIRAQVALPSRAQEDRPAQSHVSSRKEKKDKCVLIVKEPQ